MPLEGFCGEGSSAAGKCRIVVSGTNPSRFVILQLLFAEESTVLWFWLVWVWAGSLA